MREPVRLRDSKEGGCFPTEPPGLADMSTPLGGADMGYAPLERTPALDAALLARLFSEAQTRPLVAALGPRVGDRN